MKTLHLVLSRKYLATPLMFPELFMYMLVEWFLHNDLNKICTIAAKNVHDNERDFLIICETSRNFHWPKARAVNDTGSVL